MRDVLLPLRYGVISHMNIFFTCKNSLVILLQVYRLLVLVLKKRPQYRRHSIFSMIPIDEEDDIGDGSSDLNSEAQREGRGSSNCSSLSDEVSHQDQEDKNQRTLSPRKSNTKRRIRQTLV